MTRASATASAVSPMPSRRDILVGLAASAAAAGLARLASAEARRYIVPSGRITMTWPETIAPWSNRWSLLSTDHTFRVDIREHMWFPSESSQVLWDKDDRMKQIPAGLDVPGFEVRRFHDLRYGANVDYAGETVVLTDRDWIGEVDVSNSTLGSPHSVPGGQNKRWRATLEQVLGSVNVRPRLPADQALAELGASLDADGLNPRFVGEQLLLSPVAPRGSRERWGVGLSVIRVTGLPFIAPGRTNAERAGLIDELYEIAAKTPGVRPVKAGLLRGLVARELQFAPGHYSTEIQVFGHARMANLVAFHRADDRQVLVDALHRAFAGLKLDDWPET